jgi:DNA topoisomerase IA
MMDYTFTKNIESELDEIAVGKKQYLEMMTNFWE